MGVYRVMFNMVVVFLTPKLIFFRLLSPPSGTISDDGTSDRHQSRRLKKKKLVTKATQTEPGLMGLKRSRPR